MDGDEETETRAIEGRIVNGKIDRTDATLSDAFPRRTRGEKHERKKHKTMLSLVVKVAGFGVGYCYPTYSALKLLDRKAISPDDVTLWLTYFMVAFSLMVSETWGVANWCVLCFLRLLVASLERR